MSRLFASGGQSSHMALTLQTFVGKVTSLLFNMLSMFVIAFLPWSKCLLISWLRKGNSGSFLNIHLVF